MIGIKRVDRLIAAAVLRAVVLVLLVFVAIDALSALARELDEIGRGDYGLTQAALYILWTLPRRAYELFQPASVIGVVLGLGGLAATAEITAMRAGGLSKQRIALSAVGAVAVGVAVAVLVGETAGPYGERRGQAIAAGAKSQHLVSQGRSGLWAREGDTLLQARSGELRGDGVRLADVRLYDFDPDGRLLAITVAATGRHDGVAWQLEQVVRQRFTEAGVALERLPSLSWPSALDPRLLALSVVRPRYLPASDLLAQVRYLERNGLDATPYASALWSRVLFPLSALALVFAITPFAFGALRSGGFGQRIVLGIVLAIGWFLVERAIESVATVYGFDHRAVHLVPAMLLLAGSLIYFRRTG